MPASNIFFIVRYFLLLRIEDILIKFHLCQNSRTYHTFILSIISGTNEKQMQLQTHVDIIKEWSESSVHFYYNGLYSKSYNCFLYYSFLYSLLLTLPLYIVNSRYIGIIKIKYTVIVPQTIISTIISYSDYPSQDFSSQQ